jgi:hypothetical protein
MEVVLRLLSELRFVLIAVCGICCAAFVFTGLGSLRELRRAVFKLERSAIVGRALSAWLKAGLCLVIAAGIWVVTGISPRPAASVAENPLSATPMPTAVVLAPTALPTADLSNAPAVMTAVPVESPAATPAEVVDVPASTPITPTTGLTDTIVAQAASMVAEAATVTEAATVIAPVVVATATPAAQPALLVPLSADAIAANTTETPGAQAAAVSNASLETLISDCPSPDVQIHSPGVGETVTGAYNVRGTARFPNGSGKYRVDILRPNIEGWAFLWENHNEVKDGVLMPNFNSGLFPPGIYVLRISTVDGAGQETGISCRISIRIGG